MHAMFDLEWYLCTRSKLYNLSFRNNGLQNVKRCKHLMQWYRPQAEEWNCDLHFGFLLYYYECSAPTLSLFLKGHILKVILFHQWVFHY